MARLLNGIHGPFIGKVGPIIGSTWKGQPYIKAQSRKTKKKKNAKRKKGEVANQTKFAIGQFWLQPILGFVREGFRGYTETVEGFIAAKSWLMNNSFEGDNNSGWQVNPALVKVSHGTLPMSANIMVGQIAPGRFQFTWDTSYIENSSLKDQVMMLAYDVKNKDAFFITAGQFRSTGSDTLDVEPRKGAAYHIYAAFVSEDREKRSDSVYLGEWKM